MQIPVFATNKMGNISTLEMYINTVAFRGGGIFTNYTNPRPLLHLFHQQRSKLDSSAASSVTLPEPPRQMNGGEFDSVGIRPRRHPHHNSDPMAASLPVSRSGQRSTSGTHHTYEGHIHLYHHGTKDTSTGENLS